MFCSDHSCFVADAVVIAVPLGVLQNKAESTTITFVPPLSDTKRAALNIMQMGFENKVVMQFSKAFWPTNATPYIQCTVPGLRFLSLDHYKKKGVLVAHLSPPFSVELDCMTDEQVLVKVLKIVKNLFGKDNYKSAGDFFFFFFFFFFLLFCFFHRTCSFSNYSLDE